MDRFQFTWPIFQKRSLRNIEMLQFFRVACFPRLGTSYSLVSAHFSVLNGLYWYYDVQKEKDCFIIGFDLYMNFNFNTLRLQYARPK